MELTPQETKLIARLRKQDRQWLWVRWLLLAMGVFFIALCSLFGYLLHSLVSESGRDHLDSVTVFFIVLIWTKCCMYFLFGVGFVILACTKWHGDVNRMLLLKLLDAQQNETAKDTHTTS
ncbi:MAG: hypothetical protein ACYDH9_19500 [Limisphaerales bacterium]